MSKKLENIECQLSDISDLKMDTEKRRLDEIVNLDISVDEYLDKVNTLVENNQLQWDKFLDQDFHEFFIVITPNWVKIISELTSHPEEDVEIFLSKIFNSQYEYNHILSFSVGSHANSSQVNQKIWPEYSLYTGSIFKMNPKLEKYEKKFIIKFGESISKNLFISPYLVGECEASHAYMSTSQEEDWDIKKEFSKLPFDLIILWILNYPHIGLNQNNSQSESEAFKANFTFWFENILKTKFNKMYSFEYGYLEEKLQIFQSEVLGINFNYYTGTEITTSYYSLSIIKNTKKFFSPLVQYEILENE
jgi:hypothetical protein